MDYDLFMNFKVPKWYLRSFQQREKAHSCVTKSLQRADRVISVALTDLNRFTFPD